MNAETILTTGVIVLSALNILSFGLGLLAGARIYRQGYRDHPIKYTPKEAVNMLAELREPEESLNPEDLTGDLDNYDARMTSSGFEL